jgi:putative transposase
MPSGAQRVQDGVEVFAPAFARARPPAMQMIRRGGAGDTCHAVSGRLDRYPRRRRGRSGQVGLLSVGGGMLTGEMSRHATFRFCLDPTVGQQQMPARHAGAARFAFNQCLRMVKTALTQRKSHPDIQVPWSGFDLINAFNGWKKTEGAGRVLAVDTGGVAEMVVTGLPWRAEVCQQVFEEAAVDCGRALAAWSDSRSGTRKGRRVGFPRFKKKTGATPSFRLRNKHPKSRRSAIRIGDNNRARSVTLARHRPDRGA